MNTAPYVTKARAMLKKYGVTTRVRRVTPGTGYDPVTGAFTGPSTTEQVAYVVQLPTMRREQGKTVALTKTYLALSASPSFIPQVGDEVWLGGVWYKFPNLQPLNPNDTTPILYESMAES